MTRFIVQLEYLPDAGADEWTTVVRYDHDAEGSAAIREQRSDIRKYLEGEGVDVSNWDEKSYENVTESDREPADSE